MDLDGKVNPLNVVRLWKVSFFIFDKFILASQIVGANWMAVGNKVYQVELKLKGGSTMKFDGFKEPVCFF